MNTSYRRVPTRFAPETRWEVSAQAPGPNRRVLGSEVEHLKNRLLREHLASVPQPALAPVLRRAANEAAALAWLTPYPLLLLPTLMAEKIDQAKNQAARQDEVRRRSQTLLVEAA